MNEQQNLEKPIPSRYAEAPRKYNLDFTHEVLYYKLVRELLAISEEGIDEIADDLDKIRAYRVKVREIKDLLLFDEFIEDTLKKARSWEPEVADLDNDRKKLEIKTFVGDIAMNVHWHDVFDGYSFAFRKDGDPDFLQIVISSQNKQDAFRAYLIMKGLAVKGLSAQEIHDAMKRIYAVYDKKEGPKSLEVGDRIASMDFANAYVVEEVTEKPEKGFGIQNLEDFVREGITVAGINGAFQKFSRQEQKWIKFDL